MMSTTILTLKEMQDRLAQMTYREGWKMEIYQGHTEGAHFHLHARVEDSVNKGQMVDLDIHSVIPAQVSLQSFDLWVSERLRRIEIHESMEWLQVEGKPVFDPHRPQADHDIIEIL